MGNVLTCWAWLGLWAISSNLYWRYLDALFHRRSTVVRGAGVRSRRALLHGVSVMGAGDLGTGALVRRGPVRILLTADPAFHIVDQTVP